MEKLLCKVHQNVQDALKKFQDNNNKKRIWEGTERNKETQDFNKHQREAKDTTKKEDMN
jgi:hypothetical protein